MEDIRYAIICVDDEPLILQMLGFQLEKIINADTTLVECFEDPIDALENFNEIIDEGIEIVAVIVDYQMPKLNGSGLTRKIKSKYPDIPVIMVSGQANSSDVDQLQDDKMLDAFIPKPWDEEELFDVLTPHLKSLIG